MIVIQKKLAELRPYKDNPRYNDEAVGPVAKSIEEFGFLVPLVISNDNEIIAGHTRYKAAKKLKLKTVPAVVADELSEEQISAFRLADNKVGEIATWDDGLLEQQIKSILNIDMTDFGFVLKAIDEIEDGIDLHDEEVPNTDDGINISEEPTTVRPGDIYILGKHRLMCGNPSDANDLSKLFEIDLSKLKGVKLNLDTKTGAASSIIAKAEEKGQTAYCIDLEPRNVDRAIKRWEEITQKKAAKVEGDKHEQKD